MKHFVYILLVCFAVDCFAQGSLSIFDVDASAFPKIKAKLYAFDNAGNQQSPNPSDITITEDGISRNVVSVICPPKSPSRPLSSVLVMDVSGSMSSDAGGKQRVNIAQDVASLWVNALPLGQSECAITSFDDKNYLNQDFTTNRTKLLNAIQTIGSGGGTDYNVGLLQPLAGGLVISTLAKHQKIIVFLTDGLSSNVMTNEIIAEAKRQNCIIYCVTIALDCPQTLKDISEQTGGKWFEDVVSQQDADDVYRAILRHAQNGLPPCEVLWESGLSCKGNDRYVQAVWSGFSAEIRYPAPPSALTYIQSAPSILYFKSKPIGVKADTMINVSAVNSGFIVTNVTSSNPQFEINPKQFSLASGESKTLTVSFTPADSGSSWTIFTIETNLCSQTYYASGGYPGVRPKLVTLKLEHPNGGEVFVSGDTAIVKWSGILPSSPVRLEFSSDRGGIWNTIGDNVSGLSSKWIVPSLSSNECLIRVFEYADTMQKFKGLKLGDRHNGYLNGLSLHPSLPIMMTTASDGRAIVWDQGADSVIMTLESQASNLVSAQFNHDGSLAITLTNDSTAIVWDVTSGMMLTKLKPKRASWMKAVFYPDGIRAVIMTGDYSNTYLECFDASTGVSQWKTAAKYYSQQLSISADGKYIALTGSSDPTIRIYSTIDGSYYKSITCSSTNPNASFSPVNSSIVGNLANGSVSFYDITTGSLVRTISIPNQTIQKFIFTYHTDKIIAYSSAGTKQTFNLLDGVSGAVLKTYPGFYVNAMEAREDNSSFVAVGSFYAIEYDISTGNMIDSMFLVDHTTLVNDISFTDDGKRVLSIGGNAFGWDAAARTKSFQIGSQREFTNGRLSPDLSMIMKVNYGVSLHDIATQQKYPEFNEIGHKGAISHSSYSPDAKMMVTAGYDSTAIIWDNIAAMPLKILRGHRGAVRSAFFNPDGTRVLTASNDSTVIVWDVATGTKVLTITDGLCVLNQAVYSKDGTMIATAGDNTLIKLWDAQTGALIRSMAGHWNPALTVDFSYDGKRLASSGLDRSVIVWDVATGTQRSRKWGQKFLIRCVKFSPDNKYIVSTNDDHTTMLWNAATGDSIGRFYGHTSPVREAGFSRDGKKLLTTCSDYNVFVWDVKTRVKERALNSNYSLTASFSPVNSDILLSSTDGSSRIIDSVNKIVGMFARSGKPTASKCEFSADSKAIYMLDFYLSKWDIASGKKQWQSKIKNYSNIIIPTPDGKELFVFESYSTYSIYNANSGALIGSYPTTNSISSSSKVAISNDGKMIAMSLDGGTVTILDVQSRKFTQNFSSSAIQYFTSMCFSRDGRYLLVAGYDYWYKRYCLIYQTSDWQVVKSVSNLPANVTSADISPDNNFIALGLGNNEAYIWEDVPTYLQSDTSDAVFSIVMPQYVSTNIDMGKVVVKNAKDSVLSTFVRNTGSYSFRVDSIWMSGNSYSEFSLVSGIPPFTVPAGKSRQVEFRFKPSSVGYKSANINIKTQANQFQQTISGEGVLPQVAAYGNVIDFGQVAIGSLKDTVISVAIKNVGTAPVNFTGDVKLGPDKKQYSVLAGGGAFKLLPNQSRTVTLRFSPQFIGRSSGQIGFTHDAPGSPAILTVFGWGIGGEVFIPDDSAAPGERRLVPIILAGTVGSNYGKLGVVRFKTEVEFNASLLAPDGIVLPSVIDNGRRTLTIEAEWDGLSDTLTSIPFIAALGDAVTTSMNITKFEWLDAFKVPVALDVETHSGVFTLLDLCTQGGTRLLSTDGAFSLSHPTPNPASSYTTIRYDLLEEGYSELVVTDVMGRVVAVPMRGDAKPGTYTLQINTSAYASGKYFFTLRTPTLHAMKMMLVEH